MRRAYLLTLVGVGLVIAAGAVGAVTDHAVDRRVETRTVVSTPPPAVVTATATATATVVKTKPVVVPSPVYVTVTNQPPMTQYAAQAYCNDLAAKAWPDGSATGDPLLDQIGNNYTQTQRQATASQCMHDQGY